MEKGQIVIVVDTSNYKSSYSEDLPFKAIITSRYDINIVVLSLTTNKEYELYEHQLLEGLPIEEISNMLKLSEYGK